MHAIRANPTWRCVVRAPRSTCRTLARRSQSSQADSTTYATGLRHVETNLYSTPRDDWSNIPASIVERTARQLHRIKGHPLHTLKSLIEQHFNNDPSILNQASTKSHDVRPHYAIVDALPPVVSVQQNFDSLDIPAGHVSRSKNDTYYVDRERLLRTHTSAHQVDLLRDCQGDDVGDRGFLMTADVYRRRVMTSCVCVCVGFLFTAHMNHLPFSQETRSTAATIPYFTKWKACALYLYPTSFRAFPLKCSIVVNTTGHRT